MIIAHLTDTNTNNNTKYYFNRVKIENIANAYFLYFPWVRLVGDNIDYKIHARVQSQNHKNRSTHWMHQFAVLERVQDPKVDTEKSQKQVEDIQLEETLSKRNVQSHLVKIGQSLSAK